MERSKKILFGVIAFVIFSLVIILCLYSYNNFDSANAYDVIGKDSTLDVSFPFNSPNVLLASYPTNLSINYGSILSSSTSSTIISNNVCYRTTRSNLGNYNNQYFNITNSSFTYGGVNYFYNTYNFTGALSNASSYVNRMTFPISLLSGYTYYINFYFDINYVSSNLPKTINFSVGNNYTSFSDGFGVGSLNIADLVSSYYSNLNYNINDFLFVSIPFSVSNNYSSFAIFNNFKSISFGFNVSVTPMFNFNNLNTYVYNNSFSSTNSYIYEYLLYGNSGFNPYYAFLQNDYVYCDLLLNNNRFYYLGNTYNNSTFTLNFSNATNFSTNATLEITPSYMKFNYNGLTSFNFSISLFDKSDNYQLGYSDGFSAANVSNTNSYNTGYNNGYSSGYNVGYTNGLSTASNSSFLGLLTASIESPLNAVLNMFDFEILGYNMKTFYLGLFSVALILFLIKVVLGNVGGKKDG